MDRPIVAIVGRPNVGKSTLFNRLVGRRLAIVEGTPGITRDRLYADADWCGREFVVTDTGGLLFNETDPLTQQIVQHAELAMDEADVLVFLTDVRDGITATDWEVAERLRKGGKPVLLAVNKADNQEQERQAHEFYQLGLGEVYGISSLQGLGVGDLLDAVVARFPEAGEVEPYPEDVVRIAIIGRPNVGKSSILNSILGEERSIVSEIPGTTRDSFDTLVERNGRKLVLVDTAGIRRAGKIQGSPEYYMVLRAIRALEHCDVAAIVVDAGAGLMDGDKRVAGYARDAGRAAVIVVNKWDLRKSGPEAVSMQKFAVDLRNETPFLSYAPVVFGSATEGWGMADAVDAAVAAAENHAMRIGTGELNRLIHEAVDARPLSDHGKQFKVYYATMASVKPPTVALFTNDPSLLHFSYARYLENQIRRKYCYEGTPIRIVARRAESERTT